MTAVHTEVLVPGPARRLAGLLDLPGLPEGGLPPLWHWMYFQEATPQADLGHDGHPKLGIPSPPGPDFRRMFAGGRLRVRGRLDYDAPATRIVRVLRTEQKQGRAGRLTFVTTAATVEQGGMVAIHEEQDIVYLPADPSPAPLTVAPTAEPPDGEVLLAFRIDPVVLFRFSALTYNAHRIHYDREFAATEGHPDLVVHGPLQAMLLAETLRRSGPGLSGQVFSYRLRAPAYGAQELAVRRVGDGDAEYVVTDRLGRVTATARVSAG